MTANPVRQLGSLLRFAVRHSLRDMSRNRMRTLFALVCVATGVASVVALRSLGFMVGDALTTNLAEMNRGDLRIFASTGVPELVELSDRGLPTFNAYAVDLLRAWAAEERVALTVARMMLSGQITRLDAGAAADSRVVMLLFVEPAHYPFYDPIVLREPAGTTLAAAFEGIQATGTRGWLADALAASAGVRPPLTGGLVNAWASAAYAAAHPRPLVVASGLANTDEGLGLAPGDRVRLADSDTLFVVEGVAEDDAETLLTLPQTVFLDYVYLAFEDLALLGQPVLPDQAFVKVPLGRDVAQVQASLIAYLQTHTQTTVNIGRELNIASVPELADQNAETASIVDDLILVMGLSSLLIGGIGIINTMLVVVSRRTLEIAVLKTLGLKANRVTLLFLVEALLMGVLGSLIGLAVGVALSYLVRGVGEEAFGIRLGWRVYPAALSSGFVLGVLVTGLFGFLPTLIAGQVRPAIVLRPNEAQMPAAGLLQTLLTLVVMIVGLGLLVNTIVRDALHVGPATMLAGGGALVGLFAGIIISNTRLGKPLPASYEFRLPRRYETLEHWLMRVAGGASRGRATFTRGLRASRWAALAYGAAAVGAAAASFVLLVTSEVWLPFGIGSAKPPGNVVTAADAGRWGWVLFWLALALAVGLPARLKARAMAGVIALGSIGITVGGAAGWGLGALLEHLIGGTVVWRALASISTGIVLAEGALAVLGIVYLLYWLVVWVTGYAPVVAVTGVVGAILVGLTVGLAAAAYLAGSAALIGLIVLAGFGWLLLRRTWSARSGEGGAFAPAERVVAPPPAFHSGALLMLGVVGVAGSVLALNLAGGDVVWGVGFVALVLLAGLWRILYRRHRLEARLILREMAGRRGRVASTLLGLSVGIAGLSVVSLTTGAASRLLQVQLGESVEGNLLVVAWNPEQGSQVRERLEGVEGVDKVSQFTTYSGILLRVNDEQVLPFRRDVDEQTDRHENSNFERTTTGLNVILSERASLANMPSYTMKEGRTLGLEDEGQHRVLLRDSFLVAELGISAGDRLLFRFDNGLGRADDVYVMLRVVGIVSRQSERTGLEDAGNLLIVPPDTLSNVGVRPQNVITVAMVDDADRAAMRRAKQAATSVRGGVLAVEISALTDFLENLLDQLKAIPTLVAWLALMAGTAIIANTVALATQERRREIGVMKAIGLKGWRVLAMLVIENGLIGLLAGVIGAGVGFLITVILVLASQNPGELKNTIAFGTMGWLILMSIGVAMAAALLAAWSAAAEKPMNVLRYE